MKSEFGKGLSYCLGLFLAHEGVWYYNFKKIYEKTKISGASSWFNGASDHLYDLQIPKTLPKTLQKRLKKFQEKVLDWGHGRELMNDEVKENDVLWSLQEAKNLLRLIDIAFEYSTIACL